MAATEKQISYLANLARRAGFRSVPAAIEAYGFRRVYACELSGREASELIDWLKSGARPAAEVALPEYETGTVLHHAAFGSVTFCAPLNDGRAIVRTAAGQSVFCASSELSA